MATAIATAEPAPRRWRLRLPEGLPDLSGRTVTVYRLAWILWALFATATFILAYSSERTNQAEGRAFYGAGLITSIADVHGTRVNPFSAEARRKGVENGDLIVRVNGQAAPAQSHDLGRLLAGPDGTRLLLTVREKNGITKDVMLTRSSSYLRDAYAGTGLTFESRRWIEFAISKASELLMFAAAALLFVRRPRDSVAALLSLAIVVNLTNPALLGGASFDFAGRVNQAFSLVLLAAALLVFPDGRFGVRWWPVPAIGIAAGLIGGIAGYWSVDVASAADLVFLFSLTVIVCAVAIRYLKTPPGIARQQIKFAVLGFVGVIVFASISQVLTHALDLPSSERTRVWLILLRNVSSALSNVAIAGGLLVALLRFRLYDADTVVGRSAAYGLLTVGFVALFAGAEKLAEIVGETYFEHSIGVAAGAIGAAVAAAVVVPLHNRVHRWAERRFQKPLIRLREGLPECLADLRESAPVDQLVAAVMRRVQAGVRSTHEAVLLANEGELRLAGAREISAKAVREWQRGWRPSSEHQLDCDRRDPLFPLRVHLSIDTGETPETIGWLLLGPRPDGSFFGKDEREALSEVAGSVARAIHIAQLREQREIDAERRIGGLEALVEKLAAAIGRGGAAAQA